MTKVKKKTRILRAIISLLFIFALLGGVVLVGYTLLLFKGIETLYRILGFAISVYFFFFLSYLLLRSIKKPNAISLILPLLFTLIVVIAEGALFYFVNKYIKEFNSLDETKYIKTSVLVTYNKELKSEKDLTNMKIGIVSDKENIEEYIIPQEIIKELNLTKTNTIVEYDSEVDLLSDIKDKKVAAGFLSGNYIDNFYQLEGYETISDDSVVLYEKSKEYEATKDDEDIKSENASFSKPFSILLLGLDTSKDGVLCDYNTDVMLIVTFNPKTLRATVTSIPRDIYVKTACSSIYRKINTTTYGCSANCAVNTVEKLFNIDIDYYAKVNFKGVVKLVDALGGVDVDVPYAFCEQNSSRKWGKNTVYVDKGMQHLNGEQALAFVRNRKTNKHCPKLKDGDRSDYTRGKNQMALMMSIAKAAMKMEPTQLTTILNNAKSNLQTNIKSKDVLSLYNLAKSIMVSDKTNLVNIQRMQLSGYSTYGWLYDTAIPSLGTKSYNTIPCNGSINEISKAMKANLNNSKITAVKKMSFDLNKKYKATILGKGGGCQARIAVLANLSSYSVQKIKNYASSNGFNVKFVDKSSGQTVSISDWSDYTFSSQKEPVGTILEYIKTLTIYVKKKAVVVPPTTDDSGGGSQEPTTPSTNEGE